MPSRSLAISLQTKLLLSCFALVTLAFFAFFAMHLTPSTRANNFLNPRVVPIAHAAAVDYFLKLDGIDGESTDTTHRNEIDIQSFSWGLSQAGSMSTGGGGGAGKVSVQDFHFTKRIDKSSPLLFSSVAKGKHIAKATLTARSPDGRDFLVITLSDVLVSSFSQQDGGGDVPMDQLSINFAKIEYEYRPIGSPPVNVKWDVKTNK